MFETFWIEDNPYPPAVDYSKIQGLDEFGEALGEASIVFAIGKRGRKHGFGVLVGRETLRAIVAEVISPAKRRTHFSHL